MDIDNKLLAGIAVGLLVVVVGAGVALMGGGGGESAADDSTATGEVTGVVEADGPLSDITLTAVGPDGAVLDTATTGPEGEYALEASADSTIVASIDGEALGADRELYSSVAQQADGSTVDFDLSQAGADATVRQVDGEKVRIAFEGAGTADDPYMIANAHQLQGMATDLDAHYTLAHSIDASATADWNGGDGFVPVGAFSTSNFDGTFDGAGHAIEGLTIDRTESDNVGLISRNTAGAVENLDLLNADINGGASSAAAVGQNNEGGTIENVHVTGTVSSPDKAGGVAGYNGGAIRLSSSDADVSHPNGHAVGGLVGFQVTTGTIESSYATGDISGYDDIGGLVGHTYGYVNNSYANGTVVGDQDVGAFTGKNGQGSRVLNGTIENSYANVDTTSREVEGGTPAGGFVGFNHHSSVVENSYWNNDAEYENIVQRQPAGIAQGNISVDVTALNASKMDGGSYNSEFESDLIQRGPYEAVEGENPVLEANKGN